MKGDSLPRLAGGLGAALLGMALLSGIALGGRWPLLLGLQAALGAAGIAYLVWASGRSLGHLARGRGTTFALTTTISTLAVVFLCVATVRAAARADLRHDLTREQVFTLAPDSIATARGLSAPVTLLAFLAPGGNPAARLETLVQRYREHTDRLTLRLLDPAQHPDLVARYGVNLAGPRMVLEQGERTVRLEVVGEAALTTALRRLTTERSTLLYFVTGHGEAALDDAASPRGLAALKGALESEGYLPRELELSREVGVPADAAAVIVAGPRRPLLPAEADTLERYLDRGGRLLVLLDPAIDAGLSSLLERRGIAAGDDLVVDPQGVGQRLGTGPSVVVASRYAKHAITERFDLAVILPTARSLLPLGVPGLPRPTPLALSADSAWAEGLPAGEPLQRDEDERGGPLPLLVVAGGEPGEDGEPDTEAFRLAVVGDSEWVGGQWLEQLGNRDLALNTLAWLTERGERITIRPRRRASSSLFLTVAQGRFLRLATVDGLPLLLLCLGIAVAWRRRRP
ncbi:MAG: GldG family protein [Deltaproteobacteria bacterium]|nr:GldG family protein [Deltaproteobacteria bacterium]